MDHNIFFDSMKKFGATPEEICFNTLGICMDKINENVIISPGWFPERLFATSEIEEVVQSSPLFQYKIWNIKQGYFTATYVKTGFGAPVVMDCLLLLGLTQKCKRLIFISSVGGLSEEFNIGDIVLPKYSVCGDGASRYLADDFLNDSFCEKQYPETEMLNRFINVTENVCQRNNVCWHIGQTFCIDTIVAQYKHLPQIINMGFNSIDMESAVAFKTAKMLNIPLVALLNVSDNAVKTNGSLMAHRSNKERNYRKFVAKEIIPQIIIESLK